MNPLKRLVKLAVISISGDALMRDRKLTAEMAAIIKLARANKYNYSLIASYLVINQGRIADVMKGRKFPNVPPAEALPSDFPTPN